MMCKNVGESQITGSPDVYTRLAIMLLHCLSTDKKENRFVHIKVLEKLK